MALNNWNTKVVENYLHVQIPPKHLRRVSQVAGFDKRFTEINYNELLYLQCMQTFTTLYSQVLL